MLMYDWYHLQQCVQVGLHRVEQVCSRHTAMQSCSNAVMQPTYSNATVPTYSNAVCRRTAMQW